MIGLLTWLSCSTRYCCPLFICNFLLWVPLQHSWLLFFSSFHFFLDPAVSALKCPCSLGFHPWWFSFSLLSILGGPQYFHDFSYHPHVMALKSLSSPSSQSFGHFYLNDSYVLFTWDIQTEFMSLLIIASIPSPLPPLTSSHPQALSAFPFWSLAQFKPEVWFILHAPSVRPIF